MSLQHFSTAARSRLKPGALAELGMSAFLVAMGVLVIINASQIPTSFAQRGPVGPSVVPIVVGVGLLVAAALLTFEVLRGRVAVPEEGEDIDVNTATNWQSILVLIASLLANTVLIAPLGWPISGAILFWGSAFALGNRSYLRNLVVALVISIGSYLVFAKVLGVELPAGLLTGVL